MRWACSDESGHSASAHRSVTSARPRRGDTGCALPARWWPKLRITVEYVRVVARVLLGSERVELTADRVDLFGNRRRGTPRGALEQQVFEVVRRTGHHGGLIPRADRNPHPHRGRAGTGQVLGHYS